MTVRRPRRRIALAAPLRSRADWRALVVQAIACAEDAEARSLDREAFDRVVRLAKDLGRADPALFDREAGAAAAGAARAFVQFARAFARMETPPETRAQLGPTVRCAAQYLDGVLHGLAERDFARAHAGRPEVYG